MPRFDPTITLGHLITVAGMLLALAVAWGVHQSSMDALKSNDLKHERLIEIHAASIHQLEVTQQVTVTKLESIKSGIDELRKKP